MSSLMPKSNSAITEDSPAFPQRDVLEESLKRYKKSMALWRAYTFIILIIAVVLIPSIIFIFILSSVESYTLKIVTVVISGIVGLLGSVRYFEFVEEKRRISSIHELRISEKEFLDRIKRDLWSRLTEKAH